MNYREVIKKNRTKTKIVLFIYLLIYTFIGLLLDVFIQGSIFHYFQNNNLIDVLKLFLTLKLIPYATISLFLFGLFSIFLSIKMFNKILLQGDNYIEITENSKNSDFKKLYNIIEELKISANMKYMPKIYLIEADYLNAFASGWNEKNTMVAITSGLFNSLTRDEIQAVMAHELTHIRNEDIKLTLIIGVMTNIMLFIVNNIIYFIGDNNNKAAQQARFLLFLLQFILPFITIILQMYLSRTREYMADSGSVELTRNPDSMINALKKIDNSYKNKNNKNQDKNLSRRVAYIHFPSSLFSTHPSIENRIKALS